MFLFEKIAVCTEVEKILPQRHLSTSETQLGPRLSSKHLLISYSSPSKIYLVFVKLVYSDPTMYELVC